MRAPLDHREIITVKSRKIKRSRKKKKSLDVKNKRKTSDALRG